MQLVIAEKPSVAQSIAKVLGADEKKDGYMEGNGSIVSWCVGHLVELAQPDAYSDAWKKWTYDSLPMIPEHWQHEVKKDTVAQFRVLKELMHDTKVDSVVCATDAGREGELIFRLVYEQTGCSKPMKRLWISSMEESAIREGFENLKQGSDYDHLYHSALCRQEADWLVGINGTRLFTVLYGGKVLKVGRVQTPTLAMLVEREAKIIDTSDYSFGYIAGWSSGKDMKELKSSLDTIRKTASELITGIEGALRELQLNREMEQEQSKECILLIQNEDLTEFSLVNVRGMDTQELVAALTNMNEDDKLSIQAYLESKGAWTTELGNDKTREFEEYHLDVRYNLDTDEIIDVKAKIAEQIDNNLSVMEQAEIDALPDPMIGLSEMREYGYTWNEMLPLTQEKALELFDHAKDKSIAGKIG